MALPFSPPLEPMLSKAAEGIPVGDFLYEPKWDGFRALVFRDGDSIHTQSRELKPLDRYFPELRAPFLASLPERCVLDGEIVVARGTALDFEALQLRIHPAKSRIDKLAAEIPASFVAFDLLAIGDRDLRETPFAERRAFLEETLAGCAPPVHLTPMTRDAAIATDWLARFEGAGLDGVMAKPSTLLYQPGDRRMFKIKHARTCDCVVAGFRWHKDGVNERVGSLLLGLHGADGELQHVGVTASFKMTERKKLVEELAPLREGATENHPWRRWAEAMAAAGGRVPGIESRWSAGKDLSWVPLRPERVCEVKFDHLEGSRFRHGTTFQRWRPDRTPASCTYAQIEVVPAFELAKIFGS
jgi:ATP-dependent DNA ligase